MKEYTTLDQALLRIEELEKELHDTEIRLCEFDIAKNEYIRKFTKADKDRVRLLNEAIKLKIDLIDITKTYREIINSNIWKKTRLLRKTVNNIRTFGKKKTLVIPQQSVEETKDQEGIAVTVDNTVGKKERCVVCEENVDFSSLKTDIKAIAFYDGMQDEANIETVSKQTELARQHGIYGFAFNFKWSGFKDTKESVMDIIVENQDIDFPFMAVWDNFDAEYGQSEDEAKEFICTIKKYIEDSRYIRCNDKPVIAINNPIVIKNAKKVFKIWKKTAKELGVGDILIWTSLPQQPLKELDFAKYTDAMYQMPLYIIDEDKMIQKDDEQSFFSYEKVIEAERHFTADDKKIPIFRTSMLNRRYLSENGDVSLAKDYYPESFYMWNCVNTAYTRHNFEEKDRFVFVNGWNIKSENACLEPDDTYGYSFLNAISKAFFNLPFDVKDFNKFDEIGYWKAPLSDEDIFYTGGDLAQTVLPGWDTHLKNNTRIAIQAHVFYPELIADTCAYLDNIPYAYDLYITTNEKYKATYIEEYLKNNCSAKNYYVEVVANKGRDVMPFIMQMKDYIHKYEYICHIHTKKSLHNDVGDIWRKYLYDNLIGSREIINQIFYLFESHQDIGVIFPENMANLRMHLVWGENKQYGEWLFKKMNIEKRQFIEEIIFPAGNMFWARTSAVKDVFEIKYKDSDFPEERGQVDGTIMHAIERIWLFVAEENGYKYQIVRNVLDDVALFE